LLDANQITTSASDRANEQYKRITTSREIRKQMEDFDVKEDRLDTLYLSAIGDNFDFKELWKCVQVIIKS
jgi:hypothetical protein